jgi:hypothetical protein
MGELIGDSLRDTIRTHLQHGRLPVLGGSAWAGHAPGDHRCACCHRTIRANEIEYEPRDQPALLYAHIGCFMVWLAESRLVKRRPIVEADGVRREESRELEDSLGR